MCYSKFVKLYSSEQEILREEINSLQAVKGRLQLRIAQLEEELKKVREENDKRDKEHTEKGEEEVKSFSMYLLNNSFFFFPVCIFNVYFLECCFQPTIFVPFMLRTMFQWHSASGSLVWRWPGY